MTATQKSATTSQCAGYNFKKMKTESLYKTFREPKTLELERTDDDRYRIVITVKKLGAVTAVEYFLDQEEAQQLKDALTKAREAG
jgi:adenosylmethionine-8-amino-7-oxononanoate aminotransferase